MVSSLKFGVTLNFEPGLVDPFTYIIFDDSYLKMAEDFSPLYNLLISAKLDLDFLFF